MLLRRFADFVLRGRSQAIGAAFAIAFVPILGGTISVLIAGLITLRKGAFEGSLVLCAAIVPSVLSYIAYPVSDQTQVVFIATGMMIAINIATWLFAVLLWRYSNWSVVLEAMMVVGIIAVCVIHIVFPDVQSWWAAQLTAYFNKTASFMGQMNPDNPGIPENVQAHMVASVKMHASGLLVASLLFNALLQVVLARWWQAAIFNPGGLRTELRQIRLSYASTVIFITVLFAAYLVNNALSLDVVPVVFLTFCLAGLSLTHALLMSNKSGRLWLALIYTAFLFWFRYCVIALSVGAMFDSLLNFRGRLRK